MDDEMDRNYLSLIVQMILTMIITVIYLLLVCAKASPQYMGRSDVLISLYPWLIGIIIFSIGYTIKKKESTAQLLPILTFMLLIQTIKGPSMFQHSTMGNVPPEACKAVDHYLIQQIQEADRSGTNIMQLRVPKGDERDNWPHPKYMGNNIARTLYRHGLISKPIQIQIVPDLEVNKEFKLDNK